MPLTLKAVNRRQFLAGSLSAGLFAAPFSKEIFAAAGNTDHWVFLSDTHVPGDENLVHERYKQWDYNPNKHFAQVREEVLKLADKPKGVIVTGDFAYLQGKPEDYRQLVKQVAPYLDGGIPFHVAFGNHDHIDNFFDAFTQFKKESEPVAEEHLTILETPNVNMFLLDSLDNHHKTGIVHGYFGDKQLEWLAEELNNRKDKPALLFAHHNLEDLQFPKPNADNSKKENENLSVEDRKKFWKVIKEHKNVKAYIYGHTHVYMQRVAEDVHLINLPALGWEFQNGKQPLGWTDAVFSTDGVQLTLHTIKNPEKDGDVRKFTWLR